MNLWKRKQVKFIIKLIIAYMTAWTQIYIIYSIVEAASKHIVQKFYFVAFSFSWVAKCFP